MKKLGIGVLLVIAFVVIVLFYPRDISRESTVPSLPSLKRSEIAAVPRTSPKINTDSSAPVVMAVSSTDQIAVLKLPNQGLVTVRVGDRLEELGLSVTQVTHDKVVFLREENGETLFASLSSGSKVTEVRILDSSLPVPEVGQHQVVIDN